MNFFQTFLIIAAILIFISGIVAKLRNPKGVPDYRIKIDNLKDKTEKQLHGKYSDSIEIYPFLNDKSKPFLVCIDPEKHFTAIASDEHTVILHHGKKKKCELLTESQDKKYFESITCRISSEELEEDLIIPLAENRHRKKSYIGKALLRNAEEFRGKVLFI